MPDPATIEAYEREADHWVAQAEPQDPEHVAWVEHNRGPGPVVDLGCGPGWSLTDLSPPRLALDATLAMLDQVPIHAPGADRVRAGVEQLPFATGSLGGAVANRVYQHLEGTQVPLALADLHRVLQADGPAYLRIIGHPDGHESRDEEDLPGRLFSLWPPRRFIDTCQGAGFVVDLVDEGRPRPGFESFPLRVRLRRADTLADTVGPGMRLLVCGLNPSPSAAAAGIAFARPGNRFWPAALASGLVGVDRDPRRALVVDGVGLTDLAKRVTRRADELAPTEYRDGLERLDRLARWLRPRAICFVGLAGWRTAVDRQATAGVQDRTIGDRPVYLMPSTSGLNAHATLDTLTDHLRAAQELADRSTDPR